MAEPRTWLDLRAGDIMSEPDVVLEEADSLADAIRTLGEADVSGAPVLDETGDAVGVLSATDVVDYLEREGLAGEERLEEIRVSAVMTPLVVDVVPDQPLSDVVGILHERGVHRVLVTDDSGLCGILSASDVIRALAEEEAERRAVG